MKIKDFKGFCYPYFHRIKMSPLPHNSFDSAWVQRLWMPLPNLELLLRCGQSNKSGVRYIRTPGSSI